MGKRELDSGDACHVPVHPAPDPHPSRGPHRGSCQPAQTLLGPDSPWGRTPVCVRGQVMSLLLVMGRHRAGPCPFLAAPSAPGPPTLGWTEPPCSRGRLPGPSPVTSSAVSDCSPRAWLMPSLLGTVSGPGLSARGLRAPCPVLWSWRREHGHATCCCHTPAGFQHPGPSMGEQVSVPDGFFPGADPESQIKALTLSH